MLNLQDIGDAARADGVKKVIECPFRDVAVSGWPWSEVVQPARNRSVLVSASGRRRGSSKEKCTLDALRVRLEGKGRSGRVQVEQLV